MAAGCSLESGDNLFQVLDDLEAALTADDSVAIRSAVDPLGRISGSDPGCPKRSFLRLQALGVNKWLLEQLSPIRVETMRSGVEDADITQAAVDMQVQQTSYEVLLATAAQIIQPTLVDFLG
jgi:flagellar hook-associated protein 3 FlgL